jgi:parallel beta-helix repeat protein
LSPYFFSINSSAKFNLSPNRQMKHSLLILLATLFVFSAHAQVKPLVQGMKINKSTKIRAGVYRLDSPAGKGMSVILIEGDNIVVDFANATLKGSNAVKTPDAFFGIGILIVNSKNVTIRNLKIRGYKVAVFANDVDNLQLDNCDLSYNYRPQLNSTQEKEDVSDWMSYHHNDEDQWLRYGAAIYLRNCNNSVVKNCKVTGGQNALMMTECNNGLVYNNDFSFNSGIGIGLYRSSGNSIMYNKVNFNVRGYSHGVYNRGQDSAGMLVYEQSNNNLFYKNSVTHGGDGLFLWAGQTTMDSGKGGCNDNKIIGNDFSYAPTNGIEVTFSRNRITDNRIFECDHGIWGGYSYQSRIGFNQFRNNRVGIAIEHGQENIINNNLFSGDKEAIRLWARKEQPADWGYAKNRDTKSRDYLIARNSFNNHPIALNINRTENILILNNTYSGEGKVFKIDSTVTGLDSMGTESSLNILQSDTMIAIPGVNNPADPFKGNGKLAGRKNIRMTQWGPYDFNYPIIWNTNPIDSSDSMQFEILGPPGKWKVKSFRGVENISSRSGNFPATITARKKKDSITDIQISLEYAGPVFTDQFGNSSMGKQHLFNYRKYFLPMNWEVLFYPLDTSVNNPVRTGILFSPTEKKAPFKTDHVNKLDYAWWGGIKVKDQQYTQFITSAAATTTVPKGEYEISLTWDDAVRFYIDDKLVIDEWNPSLYKFDESPNKKIRVKLDGHHAFRIEHLELGGFATLSLKVKLVP